MNLQPCKGCTKRTVHPNCHMTCTAYLEFRAYQDKKNDDIRQAYDEEVFYNTVAQTIRRIRKHRQRH